MDDHWMMRSPMALIDGQVVSTLQNLSWPLPPGDVHRFLWLVPWSFPWATPTVSCDPNFRTVTFSFPRCTNWDRYSRRNLIFNSSVTFFLWAKILQNPLSSNRSKSDTPGHGNSFRSIAGVRGCRSSGSLVTVVRGRPLTTASVSHSKLESLSHVRQWLPKTLFSISFVEPMSLFHQPPHHAPVGGINFQVIFFYPYSLEIFSKSNSSKRLSAPTKFLPLSLYTVTGRPLRQIKRLKTSRKASVVSDFISSKWTQQ